MSHAALILPFVLTAGAAVVAALCGHPAVNRRVTIIQMAWLLVLLPLAVFVFFLSQLSAIAIGTALAFSMEWLSPLGMMASLYYNNLSVLFLLSVAGIGTLVTVAESDAHRRGRAGQCVRRCSRSQTQYAVCLSPAKQAGCDNRLNIKQ